ncbi:MAG: PDDEXK nuclease domain-containing protein [Candidatus Margulisbacteria bacterium]|nr:PDDEXK nuclease domain-containing protein [Candidatus Margulisiibacteriota bacterium]
MIQKGNKIIKGQLFEDIKKVIIEARAVAYRAVNFTMVNAYWNIGRLIVEEEQKGKSRAGYGEKLITNLSIKLTNDFGSGFSSQSLWNMRQFYKLFPILSALRRELSWTHYKMLIRIENDAARKFYLNECVQSSWSTRQLERQIVSFYYERLLGSKNKLPVIKEAKKRAKQIISFPEEQIKDPYVLEFLGLEGSPHLRENELEQALIGHLQKFILELGRGFSFVSRQQRISTETQHFFIDLVFYNYLLKCFVLFDLKTGKLTHQDIGQMDMYVRLYENKMRKKGDNPTIGIILCTEKDDTVVKYSVLKNNRKLFASKYKLYLPSEKEFKNEIDRERQNIKLLSEKKIEDA